MLDIKNLERRWLKYKVKSFLPYITVAILSITLLIGISIWMGSKKTETKPIVQQKIISPSLNITKPTISTTEENTTFIEPSMEFVQSFQNTQPLSEVSTPTAVGIKKSIQQPTNTAITTPKTITMPEYAPAPTAISTVSRTITNNKSLSINRDESKLDINTLERRFKETSNANLGLFIARYYYDRGDYNEAYNYALKTNSTNDKIDESWIIFSKSLVKLGRTDQAKKTLQVYISQSNSENARGLLDMIENGNFK
jgi:multisubunit Na+/H+ antiporter MnhC subunit